MSGAKIIETALIVLSAIITVIKNISDEDDTNDKKE